MYRQCGVILVLFECAVRRCIHSVNNLWCFGCRVSKPSMCILFFYVNNNPPPDGYQLIVANNRDEFYDRPTKPAANWEGYPACIGGKSTFNVWVFVVCLDVCVCVSFFFFSRLFDLL